MKKNIKTTYLVAAILAATGITGCGSSGPGGSSGREYQPNNPLVTQAAINSLTIYN